MVHACVPACSSGSAGIVLWVAFQHEITEPLLAQRYFAMLSAEERLRMARYMKQEDGQRYLLTRALVRVVLSRYLEIAPEKLTFWKDDRGRPNVLNACSNVVFNISHAQGVVVLAVTTSGSHLGIDVEAVPDPSIVRDVSRYFAPEEQAALRGLPVAMQGQRFTELWTLKEAYLKALGLGLSVPLDSFGFSFPSATSLRLHEQAMGLEHTAQWRFWQFALADRCVLSVCAEADAVSTLPEMRRIVPLVFEQTLEYPLIRRSP